MPSTPITRMITSFRMVQNFKSLLDERDTNSINGGNIRAKAVLLTDPTREMIRDKYGIASANTTEKEKKIIKIQQQTDLLQNGRPKSKKSILYDAFRASTMNSWRKRQEMPVGVKFNDEKGDGGFWKRMVFINIFVRELKMLRTDRTDARNSMA